MTRSRQESVNRSGARPWTRTARRSRSVSSVAAVVRRLSSPRKVPVPHHIRDPLRTEGDQPLQPRSARPQARRAEHRAGLEGGLGTAQQRDIAHSLTPGVHTSKSTVLTHVGSLRAESTNQKLAEAIQLNAPEQVDVVIHESLDNTGCPAPSGPAPSPASPPRSSVPHLASSVACGPRTKHPRKWVSPAPGA
ncbi:UNVERIFIED_ORG: hypothetical protein ABIB21_001799 [Arthrobacter sp. UYEF13]